MGEIQLTFINRSNDQNNSEIVIFQKNVAADFDETTIAWQVIQNLGQGWKHVLKYPLTFEVGAEDPDGNQAPPQHAKPGDLWHVIQTPHGHQMSLAGVAESISEIQVRNELTQGAINAHIYKAGKLMAVKESISPQQKAVFEFKPIIWVGVVSEISEGAVMESAIVSAVNIEISLLGFKSADIVITGGGSGPDATEFRFTLENVQ